MAQLLPLPSGGWPPRSGVGPTPYHLLTAAASLRLSRLLSRRLLLRSPLQDVCGSAIKLKGLHFLTRSKDALSVTCSAFFFNNKQTGQDTGTDGSSSLEPSKRSLYKRSLTNALLAANVMLFITQVATQGRLMLWGAKINSLIDQGQLWRLVTSSFLHANIGHLLVNCYSLNSVGPSVETLCGPKRFTAVYFTSAVAGSAMSYWLCKAPSVGASGAVFGLVGSTAVFLMRHRGLDGRGTQDLQYIAYTIVINMLIGLTSRGIDNWGHVGGFLGGVAISWLLGPAWKYETISKDGRKVYIDRPPISYILKMKRRQR